MEKAMEFAAAEVNKLDEWAKGALFGAAGATIFWFGLVWAINGHLK